MPRSGALAVREDIMASLESLSPSSNVAMAVLEYVNREDIGAADIALVASADPVLTARIMRMANSAFYGMGGRISQLNVAISMLGISTVRSLAVAAVLEKVGRISEQDWKHAIETAIAASYVGPRLHADPASAFSLGMLHDLGQSLLMEFDPFGYRDILAVVANGFTEESETALKQREFERYGVTHASLGAEVLRAWNFPDDICSAIAFHHDSDVATSALLRTLRAGDRLAGILDLGEEDLSPDILLPEGFEPEEIGAVLNDIRIKTDEICSLFL